MKHLKIPRPSQQLQRQVVNASQAGWGAFCRVGALAPQSKDWLMIQGLVNVPF